MIQYKNLGIHIYCNIKHIRNVELYFSNYQYNLKNRATIPDSYGYG